MPALTPEQEMLKQAALALSAGDNLSNNDYSRAQDQYENLSPPAAILAILAQLETIKGVSTLPSTPLPGSVRQGGCQDEIRAAFERKFPLAVWDVAAGGYTQEMYTYALAGYRTAAIQQPVQAVPDGWISAAERLPETDEDGVAHVWAVNIGATNFQRSAIAGPTRHHKTLGWQPDGCTSWDWVVTHWMLFPPLPVSATAPEEPGQ